MMKESVYRRLTTLLILSVVFSAMVSTVLIANRIIRGVTDTLSQANTAYTVFDSAKDDYVIEWTRLIVLDAQRAALTVAFNMNKTTMYKEALELASDAIPTSAFIGQNIKDSAKNAAKLAISYADEVSLQKALVNKTLEIQMKEVVVEQDKRRMDTAYSHYESHIYAFNARDETPSNDVDPTSKGKIPTGGGNPSTDLSVNCSNPRCSTSYSASEYGLENIIGLSEGYHFVEICPHQHANWKAPAFGAVKNGTREDLPAPTNFWDCPTDSWRAGCPKKRFHVGICGGTCGEYNVYRVSWTMKAMRVAFHAKRCPLNAKRFFGGGDLVTGRCKGWYYTCAGTSSCDNVDNHNSSSTENPAVAPSPTPTPTPTTRSASLSSSSSSVSPYQSVSFSLSTNTAFSRVSWYVKSQGSWGLGSLIETDNGSSSSYSASLSYSFSGSGDYVITADIADYSDGSWYQASATVNVSSSSYDNTPDCSACTDGCSSCDGSSDDSSSDDSSDDSSSDDSGSYDENGLCRSCGGANYYPCAYCGATFDICNLYTSCSSSPDGWCSSVAD